MNRMGFVRAVVVAGGLLYLLTGIAQLAAPQWFFDNIGTFVPFNRHYVGDLGTFSLALGLAMLWAARDPVQHRLLIGMAAAASLFHAFNHVYDNLNAADWMQTIQLLLVAIVLVAAWWVIQRMPQRT